MKLATLFDRAMTVSSAGVLLFTALGAEPAEHLKRPLAILRIVGQPQSVVEKYLGKGLSKGDAVIYQVSGFFRVSATYYQPRVKPGHPMWDLNFVFEHQEDGIELTKALAAVGLKNLDSKKFIANPGTSMATSLDYKHIVGAPMPWGVSLNRKVKQFGGRTALLISMPDHP